VQRSSAIAEVPAWPAIRFQSALASSRSSWRRTHALCKARAWNRFIGLISHNALHDAPRRRPAGDLPMRRRPAHVARRIDAEILAMTCSIFQHRRTAKLSRDEPILQRLRDLRRPRRTAATSRSKDRRNAFLPSGQRAVLGKKHQLCGSKGAGRLWSRNTGIWSDHSYAVPFQG